MTRHLSLVVASWLVLTLTPVCSALAALAPPSFITLPSGIYPGAEFLPGATVSTAGDLNGDGRSDLVVASSTEANGPFTMSGKVRVFLADNTGNFPATPTWTLASDQTGSLLGL